MVKNHNARRWNIISSLSRKNLTLSGQIKKYAEASPDPEKSHYMKKLSNKIAACASMSLMAESKEKGTEGITAYYCSDKICYVCNSQRRRSTVRKYVSWFEQNETMLEISVKSGTKVVTRNQYQKTYKHLPVLASVSYDIMHLVLTVPHTLERGWRGSQLYYDGIQQAFKQMRRLQFWKDMVLGGEYGIETERKANGNHIHLHILVFVRSGRQNRNQLHREIFTNWNRLSIDPGNTRKPFSDYERAQMKKGNALLTDADLALMDPRGATILSLESIFIKNPVTGEKERGIKWGDKNFIKAVMEAIKYHFEPLFFNKTNKEIDLDMIADLKPILHGRALYEKFGCLRGESCLNLSADIESEYSEVSEDIDTDTGELLNREHYIVNPRFMFGDDEKITWSRRALDTRQKLRVNSTREAVQQLSNLIKVSGKTGKLG